MIDVTRIGMGESRILNYNISAIFTCDVYGYGDK